MHKIREFSHRWRVIEFALFGSAVKKGLQPDSDIDVLIAFAEGVPWSLFEFVDMLAELESIFGREVDMVEKGSLRNPFRRHEILKTAEVIYAA